MRKTDDRHMGVAEVKRNFADVVGEVVHTGRRIIVERRGRPMVAIVPLESGEKGLTAGQRLAAAMGCGGTEGAEFHDFMSEVVRARRRRLPRPVPERPR
jgi:prevent-host-death family protein